MQLSIPNKYVVVNTHEVELSGSDLAIPGVHIRSRVVIVIDTNLLGSLAGGIGEKVVVREDHHATLGGRKDSLNGDRCLKLK